jgi:hypothetical protein
MDYKTKRRRAILPLPRGGGEGEAAAGRCVSAQPLTLPSPLPKGLIIAHIF